MSKQKDALSFLATIAPMQSAIKVGDEGMRLVLDIPESELALALQLVEMRRMILLIAVVEASQGKGALPARKSKIDRDSE